MREDLKERREKTFDLLIVKGFDYMDVVRRLAGEYGVTEDAIKSDIRRMDDWLPRLVDASHVRNDAAYRLKELRSNRRELHRMAMKARQDKDLGAELAVRRNIDRNLELDIVLSQSLGLTDKVPDQARVEMDATVREASSETDDYVVIAPDTDVEALTDEQDADAEAEVE